MKDPHHFVRHLCRTPGVVVALDRLARDFGLPPPLLLAALWLGHCGVPVDVALARRLAALAAEGPAAAGDVSLPAAVIGLLEASRPRATGISSVRPWLLQVAPASVLCVEQAHWIERLAAATESCGEHPG